MKEGQQENEPCLEKMSCIYELKVQICLQIRLYNPPLLLNTVQSTLVLSKSKGLSEILRDIRPSTYQICRIGEKVNATARFHMRICYLTFECRNILKTLWK